MSWFQTIVPCCQNIVFHCHTVVDRCESIVFRCQNIVFRCHTVVDCCESIVFRCYPLWIAVNTLCVVCCCQTIVNAVNKALCFIVSTFLGAFNFIILKQTIHSICAMRVKVAKTVTCTSHNSVQAPNGNFGKTTLEQNNKVALCGCNFFIIFFCNNCKTCTQYLVKSHFMSILTLFEINHSTNDYERLCPPPQKNRNCWCLKQLTTNDYERPPPKKPEIVDALRVISSLYCAVSEPNIYKHYKWLTQWNAN